MNQVTKALKKYGLSENEINVYLSALKHEETSPYEVSKETKIPRTTVYDVMMDLSLKGLIEVSQSDGYKKQQTRIKAKNPSVLRQNLWRKRKDLVNLEVDVLGILPQLKGEYYKEEANADFMFYPGVEGAKKVLMDEDDSIAKLQSYVWTNLMPMDSFGTEFINKWVDRDIKSFSKRQRPRAKVIIPLTDWTKHVVTYQAQRDKYYMKHEEYRFIDNPVFDIHQRIVVQGERVRITCAKEQEIWGLIIKSPFLVKTFESMFHVMWQMAQPADEDFVKSLGENEYLKTELKKQKRKLS